MPRDMNLISCGDAFSSMTCSVLSTLGNLSQEVERHALKLLHDAIEHRDIPKT